MINSEGSLLAFAGADMGNDTLAAIVSNIWSSSEGCEHLEYIILECEVRKLVVEPIPSHLHDSKARRSSLA